MWRPNNPILWKDVERNPFSPYNGWPYSQWVKQDNERLEKIKYSYLRFIWRLFSNGSWHPNSITKFNQDIWI